MLTIDNWQLNICVGLLCHCLEVVGTKLFTLIVRGVMVTLMDHFTCAILTHCFSIFNIQS